MAKGTELKSMLDKSNKGLQQQRLDIADAHDGQLPPPSPTQAPSRGGKAGTSKGAQEKVIREFFSMPPDEQTLIDELAARAAREGRLPNKSHIIRAALKYLASSSSEQLVTALDQVPRVKPGRK